MTVSYIQTFTGKKFYFRDPRPEDIAIEDIAHSLSHLCRFTGHSKLFYSVAEHSVAVCDEVAGDNLKLIALLHDATEAYIGDISSPLKGQIEMREVKNLEKRIWQAVANKFGVDHTLPEEVKRADLQLLADEAAMIWTPLLVREWGLPYESRPRKMRYLAPWAAKQEFLSAFQRWR